MPRGKRTVPFDESFVFYGTSFERSGSPTGSRSRRTVFDEARVAFVPRVVVSAARDSCAAGGRRVSSQASSHGAGAASCPANR